MTDRYYDDIHNMPPIAEKDMNAMLYEESTVCHSVVARSTAKQWQTVVLFLKPPRPTQPPVLLKPISKYQLNLINFLPFVGYICK